MKKDECRAKADDAWMREGIDTVSKVIENANDDNERRARIASNIQKAKDALDRAIVLRRASAVDE